MAAEQLASLQAQLAEALLRIEACESVTQGCSTIAAERETLATERRSLAAERETLAIERRAMAREWEALSEMRCQISAGLGHAGPTHVEDRTSGEPTGSEAHEPASDGHTITRALTTPPVPHAQICFSYQSAQLSLLNRLRTALQARGFSCIDGTQVPPGSDWRRFYYPALSGALVYIPILSDTFLFSAACEDEMTFAWDKRKIFLPVLHDFDRFAAVMQAPHLYTECRSDIAEVVPKLESFLNQRNRIPSVGRFEDAFDSNLECLVTQLQHLLKLATPASDIASCAALISRRDSGDSHPESRPESTSCVQHILRVLTTDPLCEEREGLVGDLRFMCRDPQNVAVAVAAGAVPALVRMLTDPQEAVQDQVIAALQNVAGPPDDHSIMGYGVLFDLLEAWSAARLCLFERHLQALIECLGRGSREFRAHAANLLNFIANAHRKSRAYSKKSITDQISRLGGVVGLVALLDSESLPEDQTALQPASHAANTLSYMMYAQHEIQQECIQHGCLHKCLKLLRVATCPVLLEKALWLLKALAWSIPEHHASAQVALLLVDQGVAELLHRLLQQCHNAHVVCQAADLLCDLVNGTGAEVAARLAQVPLILSCLGHLMDHLGTRQVNARVPVGAASSLCRFLYNLSTYSTAAPSVVAAGAVHVLSQQLSSGPLLYPCRGEGGCQWVGSRIEWLSATLKALCAHELAAVGAEFSGGSVLEVRQAIEEVRVRTCCTLGHEQGCSVETLVGGLFGWDVHADVLCKIEDIVELKPHEDCDATTS